MVFEFDSGVKVAVRDRLLSELLDDLCELGFESESGGILLGSYDSGRDEYRIVDFTRPGLIGYLRTRLFGMLGSGRMVQLITWENGILIMR